MSGKKPITYRDAGVDIDAATGALAGVKAAIRATHGPLCLNDIGSFGGLFRVPVEDYREPVLVASTDGVGTKIKVALLASRFDSVGHDIVNHCVNDILVQGARPLFFLDYFGTGRVRAEVFRPVVAGIAAACRANGCALLGGETAEMPDVYAEDDFDLVGTIVGVVERDRVIDGRSVSCGDRLLGLPSTGLHTNGYTLARKVLLEREGNTVESRLPGLAGSLGDELLKVHRSYLRDLLPLLDAGLVRALAHITGGGLPDNLPRVLPEGTGVRIRRDSWEVPAIFRLLAERGPIPEADCYRTFNMGIGMVLVVAPRDVAAAQGMLPDAVPIGEVVQGDGGVELI